jgi:cell division protein FtsQ
MEIRITKAPAESEAADPQAAPDTSRYLRRKPTQKVRKGARRVAALVRGLGKLVFLLGLGAFLLEIFNYAYTSEKFRVRAVTFVGCKRLDTAELEWRIRASVPSNILMIDLGKVRALAESEPWVKQAEIRRVLPSDLVLYVRERVPSVILQMNNGLFIADDEGVLLDRYDPKYGKLDAPVFRGLLGENPEGYRLYQEENSARMGLGRKMLADLESGSPAFSRAVSEVDLSDPSNLRILLVDDLAEISLGDRDFLKRFRTLMSNLSQYQEVKAQYEIGSIDLRFDDQIIYRPRGGAKKPPETPAPTEAERAEPAGAPAKKAPAAN